MGGRQHDDLELLMEQAFLQRVARRLTRDEWEADDLVQDTWVSALERPPDAERSPRPWFRTVLGNHLLQRIRGARRRHEREQRVAARADARGGSAAEEAARRDVARTLWDAIEAVHEPFREALRLRYRDELDVAAIAARLDVPLETVRSRLRRGLALLRERLGESRDRSEWLAEVALLAGLARPRARTASVVGLGAVAAVLVATLVVAALLLMGPPEQAPALARTDTPSAAPAEALGAPDLAAARADVDPARPAAAPLSVRVVVAHTGDALPGAAVEVRAGAATLRSGTSDDRGRLAFVVPVGADLTLVVAETETTRARSVSTIVAPHGHEVTVAVGAVATVRGTVEAPDGSPAGDALVQSIEGTFPYFLPGDDLVVLAETRTDERGRFELRRTPVECGLVAWSRDETSFARHGPPTGLRCNDAFWSFDVPRSPSDYLAEDADVLLRLRDALFVDVLVTGPGALPLKDALLTVKGSGYIFRKRTTDARGRARLGPFVSARTLLLTARCAGYATAFVGPFVVDPDVRRIELALTPARTLDGWVVDRTGQPIAGAKVRATIEEGRPVQLAPEGASVREPAGEPSGEEGPAREDGSAPRLARATGEPAASPAEPSDALFPLALQEELGGPLAVTDELGAFELVGVDAGEWLVQAHVGGTLLDEVVARGGDRGMLLREDGGERPVVLFGAVRDAETGAAVRGALVWVERRRGNAEERVGGTGRRIDGAEWRFAVPVPGEWTALVHAEGYAPFRTEPTHCEAGEHRFDAELIPARDVLLRIEDVHGPLPGTWIVPSRASASGELDYLGLSLVADARGIVRLDDVPATALQVAVHPFARVRPLVLDVPEGDFTTEPFVVRLADDCSSRRSPVPWELVDAGTGMPLFAPDLLLFDLDVYAASGVRVLNFHHANRPPSERKVHRPRLRVPVEQGGTIRILETAAPDPFRWLGPGPLFVNGDEQVLPDLLLPAGRLRVVVATTQFEPVETFVEVDPGRAAAPLRIELSRIAEDGR